MGDILELKSTNKISAHVVFPIFKHCVNAFHLEFQDETQKHFLNKTHKIWNCVVLVLKLSLFLSHGHNMYIITLTTFNRR